VALLILSLTVMSTVAVAQPEIANRSFEDGTAPGEAASLAPGSNAIEGWTVVDGNISYVGGRWPAAQGARSVGLPCGAGISQTIATEPDRDYEIRFSMAGDPTTGPALKTLVVTFGADKRVFTFDGTGRSLTDMGWASRTWVFKARSERSTLTFLSPKAADCSVAAVDSVRIEAIEIGVQAHPEDSRRLRRADAGED
jgi:choice-of-anchor C domain-containing protein